MDKIENRVRENVLARLDSMYDPTDDEIRTVIRDELVRESKEYPISIKDRASIENHVFNLISSYLVKHSRKIFFLNVKDYLK